MTKPIIVINYCVSGRSRSSSIRDLLELQEVLERSNANDEYYTFLLPINGDSHIQVFYEKDFNEIKYKELKKTIEEKISILEKQQDLIDEEPEEDIFEEKPSKFNLFLRKIGILPKI